MIAFIEGLLAEKKPMLVVVATQGIGYEVNIPLSTYDHLPAPGQSCRLLIYDHVREDIHALYGFATGAEKELFLRLMSVSGIGPRLALSTLSGLAVREIKRAIVEGDIKRLSSVSGIGKKTAERMIVELRDKIGTGEALEALAGPQDQEAAGDARVRDAVQALVSLGYKQADAWKMVGKSRPNLGPATTVEELIRLALMS